MPIRTPGLLVTEHELEVPLGHARPGGERIRVFAREVADPDGTDRPFLVFFEGGPGSLLGMSDGAERLHYLLELPPDSPAFLHDVEAATPFARNPIYAVLHEAC